MDIVLIGSGGCMREIVWQMQEQNKTPKIWNILGFIDKEYAEVHVGQEKIPYLGDDEFLLQTNQDINVPITIGNPRIREGIYNKLSNNTHIHFPVVILDETSICQDVEIGEGSIISKGVKISTNGRLGKFFFVNLDVLICHDALVGDYVTLSPSAKLAGNVSIEKYSDIGIGATIIQGIHIGENVRLGAGCVVINNIEGNCTAVGVPARRRRGTE